MVNSVKLNLISQNYGEVQALININLEIKDGEFFSLLGPSGSVKRPAFVLLQDLNLQIKVQYSYLMKM